MNPQDTDYDPGFEDRAAFLEAERICKEALPESAFLRLPPLLYEAVAKALKEAYEKGYDEHSMLSWKD